jgi:hypothetical protein
MASWAKWAFVAAGGLLSTSCLAAAIGGGVGVVVVGAGVVAFTCYDRVSVTVTDRLTGTKLCDAKVTFTKGSSETEATSCYQAALSAGKYKMRVERHGLLPFEQPVDVVKSSDCGGTIQTMYIALDRPNRVVAPAQVAPPPPAVTPAPAPAVTVVPSAAPVPAEVPEAPAPPPAQPPAPPPAASSFPSGP